MHRWAACLHDRGTPLLVLLHRWLFPIGILLPEATVQDLNGCIVHALPAVEAAALAERTDAVRIGVVKVVEEHLVEAVPSAKKHGHHLRENGVLAVGVLGEEGIPKMRMVDVCEDGPRHRKAGTGGACHGQQEAPSLAERATKGVGAQEPDATPKAAEPRLVLQAGGKPLLEEVLVALSARLRVGEVEVPKECKERPGVAGTQEVPNRHKGDRQPTVPLIGPLLKRVEPGSRVPTKLAVDEEVHRACVVSVVLQDDLGPRQRDEVGPGVRDVVLPLVGREGGTVNNIVKDVDILDHQHGERNGEECRSEVPIQADGQHPTISQYAGALGHKNEGVYAPHVHHLLR
mmetsp:Transcript_122877/g.274352  ORF Transcript_122877/g.274352 Transcript_122877/m.274352 type:complete len:345 (+) Transcript_122877:102-1136(+)